MDAVWRKVQKPTGIDSQVGVHGLRRSFHDAARRAGDPAIVVRVMAGQVIFGLIEKTRAARGSGAGCGDGQPVAKVGTGAEEGLAPSVNMGDERVPR